MSVRVRYDTADENGETRRERNTRLGFPAPQVDIPPAGAYLWSWYWEVSDRLRRVRDGACEPIAPSEFSAWCNLTDTVVYPVEYAILCAVDAAFCSAMNSELRDYQERENERRKDEIEKSKSRRGR